MIKKPLLVIVTGRPASGKTTLAHILTKEIKCPLLSRDQFKEGYINTLAPDHNQPDEKVNKDIYETFFQAIDLLISKNISIIAEAAFQHKLWEPKLTGLFNKSDIRIIVCKTTLELARERFYKRISDQPERKKFHGEDPNKKTSLLFEDYEMLHLPLPTLRVDTTNNYNPGLEKIVDFLRLKN